MHPFVTAALINEIVEERHRTARHARPSRPRERRETIRRLVTGR